MNIFLHGLDSSSNGTKGSYFRTHFPDMLVPDFSGSLQERMVTLNSLLTGKKDVTLIGSSFGGLMAAIFAIEHSRQTRNLILLAPALNFPDFDQYAAMTVTTPTLIYQGNKDDVTPLPIVKKRAQSVFSTLTFYEVDDDHFLRHTFPAIPWSILLTEKPEKLL